MQLMLYHLELASFNSFLKIKVTYAGPSYDTALRASVP